MRESLKYDIALRLLPDIGVVGARMLLDTFGSAEKFFSSSASEIASATTLSPASITKILSGKEDALRRAEKEQEFVDKHHLHVWTWTDEDYPEQLRFMHDAPTLLYGKGNISLQGHILSVVGTRSCSDRGRQICHDLVSGLAQRIPDLTIVSGLAYGIDVASHKAAIEAGLQTIAVTAHGLDRIYPASHRQTAVQMLEHGGVITEYMTGTEPERQNFVERNRIVAGLAEAVLVVESKAKGGSLITADLAFNYGRDVLAVPGRPSDVLSEGCNNLIRRNVATLVTSADDIIETLGWEEQHQPVQTSLDKQFFADLNEEESKLMQILREHEDGVLANTIVEETEMPFASVSALLFQLELKGLVRTLPGGQYRAT